METNHVKIFYELLGHREETEIRLVDPHKKKEPLSIFIHSQAEFVEECKKYEGEYNIYAGINERIKGGTKAVDVISVKTIVIDIDSIRASGNKNDPTTEIELQKAIDTAQALLKWGHEKGFKDPRVAMSGNGIQLYYCIPEIPFEKANKEKTEEKLQMFQKEVSNRFNTSEVKIDHIGDLPRIIKVIGTKSIKGIATLERPHRTSHFLEDVKNIKRDNDVALANYIGEYKIDEKQKNIITLPQLELEKLNQIRLRDNNIDKLLSGDLLNYGSRSEADMAVICKLMGYGFNKDTIYTTMDSYMEKWKLSPPAYKKRTYEGALQYVSQKTKEKEDALLFEKPDENGFDKIEDDPHIMKYWLQWFTSRSWNNELFGRISLMSLIGCTLHKYHRGIQIGKQHKDTRIHIGWIQPPSSGKTEACSAINIVAKKIDIRSAMRTKITSDASLTGTFRDGRTKAEKAYIKDTGKLVYEKGDLECYDMLIIPEASNVLTSVEGEKEVLQIQNTILQAMDKGGIITKKKADSPPIEFFTGITFVMTSRETRELRDDPEILLKNGLAQRTLLLIRNLSDEEYKKNTRIFIDLIGKEDVGNIEFGDELPIHDFFKKLNDYASSHDIHYIDEEGKKTIAECFNDLYATGEYIKSDVHKRIYYTFVARYLDILTRLGLICAYLRCIENPAEIEEVTKIDIKRGYSIIKQVIEDLLPWFEENRTLEKETKAKDSKNESMARKIMDIWNGKNPSNKWVYCSTFINNAAKEMGVSPPTIYRYIKKMKFDYIGISGDNNRQMMLK